MGVVDDSKKPQPPFLLISVTAGYSKTPQRLL